MQYFRLKGKGRSDKSADVYALGCCMPEMLALADMNLTKPYRDAAFERNKKMVINLLFKYFSYYFKNNVIKKIEMLFLSNLTFKVTAM